MPNQNAIDLKKWAKNMGIDYETARRAWHEDRIVGWEPVKVGGRLFLREAPIKGNINSSIKNLTYEGVIKDSLQYIALEVAGYKEKAKHGKSSKADVDCFRVLMDSLVRISQEARKYNRIDPKKTSTKSIVVQAEQALKLLKGATDTNSTALKGLQNANTDTETED